MKIGYACLTVGVPNTTIRTTRKANATPERLEELVRHNLQATERMLDYNIEHGIRMYRISSDLVPFGSDYETNTLDWVAIFQKDFDRIGGKIRAYNMRVSMHPGQYTVLNSLDEGVVSRAIDDLDYHAQVLDALGVDASHKIILHIGGVYGDKKSAITRFVENYKRLRPAVKDRLIIENDDRLYTIEDVLEISRQTGAPVVYDNLHNASNASHLNVSDAKWIALAKETWGEKDGPAKIHYSQQRPEARIGAHTETIYIQPFMDFYQEIAPLDVDIMLEVKDKNLSAVKAILATTDKPEIKDLENEWARYKYAVLARSPQNYEAIRSLLKDKSAYPVLEFYTLIEEALDKPAEKKVELNALEHVWGHVKKAATEKERDRFLKMKADWLGEKITVTRIKNWLYRLAKKYKESYLLQSLYFDFN